MEARDIFQSTAVFVVFLWCIKLNPMMSPLIPLTAWTVFNQVKSFAVFSASKTWRQPCDSPRSHGIEVMLSLSRSHSPWPCASTSQRWRPTSPAFRPKKPRALPRTRAVKGNYDLVDLVSLSVASTVGSGVFSLAGRVANQEAGPAVVVSLGIGALGCLLSATAYAELSSRVVAAGPGQPILLVDWKGLVLS